MAQVTNIEKNKAVAKIEFKKRCRGKKVISYLQKAELTVKRQ